MGSRDPQKHKTAHSRLRSLARQHGCFVLCTPHPTQPRVYDVYSVVCRDTGDTRAVVRAPFRGLTRDHVDQIEEKLK